MVTDQGSNFVKCFAGLKLDDNINETDDFSEVIPEDSNIDIEALTKIIRY